MPVTITKLIVVAALLLASACGGGQTQDANIETRPLEESKAFEIIEDVLVERGYKHSREDQVILSNDVAFPADFRVTDEEIAIEFLTEQDRAAIGQIPPPAGGSRLHVLAARSAPTEAGARGGKLYVFFIQDNKFVYHVNPTSEQRADVTFLEVDSRLRRDLADFLSWYETNKGIK